MKTTSFLLLDLRQSSFFLSKETGKRYADSVAAHSGLGQAPHPKLRGRAYRLLGSPFGPT